MSRNKTDYNKQLNKKTRIKKRFTIELFEDTQKQLQEISLTGRFKGRYQSVLRAALDLALKDEEILQELRK